MSQNGVSIVGAVLGAFAVGSVIGWAWSDASSTRDAISHARHLEFKSDARGQVADTPELPSINNDSEFNERLEKVLATRSKLKRSRAVAAIADGLNVQQIRAALKVMERTHVSEREGILRALFARWGEIQPEAALAYARTSKDEYAFRMVVEVTTSWARTDFDAALASTTKLARSEMQKSAVAGVLKVLSETDPKRALELAKENDVVLSISDKLFLYWAEKSPEEAAHFAMGLQSKDGRNNAISSMVRTWAERDLAGALRWLETLPDRDAIGDSSWSSPANCIFAAWADEDPDGALRWLEEMPENARRAGFVRMVKSEIGLRVEDVGQFSRFAELMPAGRPRDEAWVSFMYGWSERDLTAAITWAREQPREMQDATIANLARKLALDDPMDALKLTASLSDKVRDKATGEVLSWWARKDPNAAAKWAQEQPPNAEYFKGVATSFIVQDLAGATEWTNALPAGSAKDAMMVEVSARLQQQNPQIAAAWIEGISDAREREDAYEELALTWLYNDPAAAKAWIESAPVSDALKAKLLKPPPK